MERLKSVSVERDFKPESNQRLKTEVIVYEQCLNDECPNEEIEPIDIQSG
jgi:hypothetical protein